MDEFKAHMTVSKSLHLVCNDDCLVLALSR